QYGIKKIIADNFRMEAIRPLLVAEGFEIEVIRNPKAIHSLLAPRIEMAFANKQIVFDDNPLMRWYTQNVL
ncbi:terminase, partial [Bacillus thuringiensis]